MVGTFSTLHDVRDDGSFLYISVTVEQLTPFQYLVNPTLLILSYNRQLSQGLPGFYLPSPQVHFGFHGRSII